MLFGLRDKVLEQGDQIGRIFAEWVIVYFGKFLKITEVVKIRLLCTVFHDKSHAGINFEKKNNLATS
jgi:hypothetical protein